MKLKSPLIILAEIKRIDGAITELHRQQANMKDEDVKKVCTMSLNELKIRKSTLEWVIK